jgi:hypothetical protein
MEECRAAYQAAAEWFAFWRRGDVVEGEAALIAEKASQRPGASAAALLASGSI